jgi:cellulose synthase/poly-beta-1,6-N-acetylglucosamine synthase-like glycosyltransferase
MIWWPGQVREAGRGRGRMISVVIATRDSEVLLASTLAALVPGAVAGLVREVIVADGGSTDATATVADVAGCRFFTSAEPLGARLSMAAAMARADWLLFLRPGSVPGSRWIDEVQRFLQDAQRDGKRAAVFRSRPSRSRLTTALTLLATAVGALPRPERGLLIAKSHYKTLGGHRASDRDPERGFMRRIGRRRIELLRSRAGMLGD